MDHRTTFDSEAVTAYEGFRLKRGEYHLRYIIYKISDDRKFFVMEKTGDLSKTYDDFTDQLTAEGDCRYGLVDVDYTMKDGKEVTFMVLIFWIPDSARFKNKSLYAAAQSDLTKLINFKCSKKATNASDFDLDTVIMPMIDATTF